MSGRFGATSTTDDVLNGLDLAGLRVLVTGVSAGLGVETARALSAHGAKVIGTARDIAKGRRVTGDGIDLIELDLASLASVRASSGCLVRLAATMIPIPIPAAALDSAAASMTSSTTGVSPPNRPAYPEGST